MGHNTWKHFLFNLVIIVILSSFLGPSNRLATYAAPMVGVTERVSESSSGIQGNGESYRSKISGDGNFVVFESSSTNLVSEDTNGKADIFVHDHLTRVIERVSISTGGDQGNGDSEYPSISADGRYVAFNSSASNLISGDTNGERDVFVHDLQTRVTNRVSVSSSGEEGNGSSYKPSISADGRYMAFYSSSTNLVNSDTNGEWDIFVHDRQTEVTERVSVSSGGAQANDYCQDPSISADGRYVAFISTASNLVIEDTNEKFDIFVHDRQNGVTERISVSSSGEQSNERSMRFSISADGRFIAFSSDASNLVNGDTNEMPDIFVHDRQTEVTERVSVALSGDQANYESYISSISSDGRFVAFDSYASNLVSGDTNDRSDIFVLDRQTGAIERISVSSSGDQANNNSRLPSISNDGRFVAYESRASNLVSGDTNMSYDIFFRDRCTDGSCDGSYGISGRVIENDGTPIDGVTMTSSSGDSTITNKNGEYVFLELPIGSYEITPNHSDYEFEPSSRIIYVGPDKIEQDFTGHECLPSTFNRELTSISSFCPLGTPPKLDIPFDFSDFDIPVKAIINGVFNDGRVTSWFDHYLPYPFMHKDGDLLTWEGYKDPPLSGDCNIYGYDCYDNHEGTDFDDNILDKRIDFVLAAAPGVITKIIAYCKEGMPCNDGNGYGNQVWIDHENGFGTLYAHLSQICLIEEGDRIEGVYLRNQCLGVIGSTGCNDGDGINDCGTHLHFGVYYGPKTIESDGDDKDEYWERKYIVDPYGWWDDDKTDPWTNHAGMNSQYLWKYPPMSMQIINSNSTTINSPTGRASVEIEEGTFSVDTSVQLIDSQQAPDTAGGILKTIVSFWLRIFPSNNVLLEDPQKLTIEDMAKPVTVIAHYEDEQIKHLIEDDLEILWLNESNSEWEILASESDIDQNRISALTSNQGKFAVQGTLVCANDIVEPNDSAILAVQIPEEQMISGVFDIQEDEDWYKFEANRGTTYTIEGKNLNLGVDPDAAVYNGYGNQIASDKDSGEGDGFLLLWSPQYSGTHYIRVIAADGSAYGCDASYEISISEDNRMHLPIIIRRN